MHEFVRRRSAAEEFNPRPVLPCTDVLLPQRKTRWWGWLNKLWVVSTPRVIICRPLRRFMLYRGFTARRSTCHGGKQRARGQVELSRLYLVPQCKKNLFTYIRMSKSVFIFLPYRSNQVSKEDKPGNCMIQFLKVIYSCAGTICPCCSFFIWNGMSLYDSAHKWKAP